MLTPIGPKINSQELNDNFSQIEQRFNNARFDVIGYGAKGDGTTDDTAAITATLAAAAVTGGEVFFPPGIYIYSALFSPASNIVLNGVYGASIIKMKPSALPTFNFINVGNISNVIIKNLTFIGNLVLPTSGAGTASQVLYFLNCTNITVEFCNFSNYMGMGIAFQGGSNTNVYKCNFTAMGQNQTGLSNKIAVPAVWLAYGNKDSKVSFCKFYDCRWAAVFLLASYSEVSDNKMELIGESCIYSEYSAVSPTGYNIVSRNIIKNVYQIDVTACGIEWTTSYSVISDNVISQCDADCIAITTCSYVTVKNNVVSNGNNSNVLNGSGIAVAMKLTLQSVVPTYARGIIIEGNVCYDDAGTPHQKYGINVYQVGGGAALTYSSIVNNQLYRNVTTDMNIEVAQMDDPTNIIKNNGGWLDIQQNNVAFTTSSITQVTMGVFSIPAKSMGKNRGIRVKAWGTSTGTAGLKTIYLKYDTSDSEFAYVQFAAAENGMWRIEGEVHNVNASNVQNRSAVTYKGNALYQLFNSAGAIDSTIAKNIAVIGVVANAADSLTLNGLFVERL